MNSAPPPSSFDQDLNFYEESRWQKLRRRLVEEPLIPLGCALTCWALYEATKSMKTGDHHRTNRMFRRRIYAQGFTLLAMVAGSAYWKKDRAVRNEYNELVEEKQKREKHEAWIKELEIRDQEDEELRQMKKRMMQGRGAEEKRLSEAKSRAVERQIKPDGSTNITSVLEPGEARRDMGILGAAIKLWHSSS
ncbi:hypothetical protein MBLNU459_g4091t1 [Dothideomycetes sp. NU459]